MKLVRTYLEEGEENTYCLVMVRVNFIYRNRPYDFGSEFTVFDRSEYKQYFKNYCRVPMFKELNRIVDLNK